MATWERWHRKDRRKPVGRWHIRRAKTRRTLCDRGIPRLKDMAHHSRATDADFAAGRAIGFRCVTCYKKENG